MGFDHSTSVAYGVHVPEDKWQDGTWAAGEGEFLDRVISGAGLKGTDVGWVDAGDYDRDMLFVVCSPPYDRDDELTHTSVELGTFRHYPASWFEGEQRARWDELIKQVCEAAGYGDLGEPGWIVCPDVS